MRLAALVKPRNATKRQNTSNPMNNYIASATAGAASTTSTSPPPPPPFLDPYARGVCSTSLRAMAAYVDPYQRRALDLAGKRPDAEIDHGLKTAAGYYPILGVPYLDLKDPFCETTSTRLAAMLRMFDAPVPVIHGPEDPFCDTPSTGLAAMLRMFHAPVSVIHGPERLPWNIKSPAATSILERMYQTKTLASFAPPATASGSMVANPGGAPVFENRFFLDSGASYHAVGDGRMLRGIQLYSFGMWVELPDGSPLRIVGVGTLQMDDPSVCGKHVRSYNIPNVRLVAGLQKNLISVSQLDRDHGLCCSFHSKKCEIMMADGTFTGGAILEEDGMYVLRFLEV